MALELRGQMEGFMANDDPTSLRMGFGYHQARAAGMSGFEEPPSESRMNFDLRWKAKEKELRTLVEQNPSIGPIVREIIKRQTAANCYSVDEIIWELRHRKLVPMPN
jgi:hypothetical protein